MIRCLVSCVAAAACAIVAAAAEDAAASHPPRVAILPTISDVGTHAGWRPWTKSFDAALQAELLEGWETIVSSRAGLSTVVFEQRLAISKGEREDPPQVRPADFLVFVVLDARTKSLRVHTAPVGEDMREIGEPVVHGFNNGRHFATAMPERVAKDIAARIGLKKRKDQAEPEAADDAAALRLAIVPPFSALPADHSASGMVPVFNAMLEAACLAAGTHIDLVEREEISRLLGERELIAGGATTADITTVSAADVARIAGARFILVPYLFPTHQSQARVTVHAIDSATGQIVAARTWQQHLDKELPADTIRDLLASAAKHPPDSTRSTPDGAALRHAEAQFLLTLRQTLNHLRPRFRERIEINLLLADAAIALAHDDTTQLVTALHHFLHTMPWRGRLAMEFEGEGRVSSHKRAHLDGTLAEMHRHIRRIFEPSLREVFEQRNGTSDRARLAHMLTLTGHPREAIELFDELPGGARDIFENWELTRRYPEALVEDGRLLEAKEFLELHDRRHTMRDSTFQQLCDIHRALGNHETEIRLMFRDHRDRLKNFDSPRLARFLEIAPLHPRPDQCLLVFNRHAHSWYRNNLEVLVHLPRLRTALDQPDLAVEAAQCGQLASLIAGREVENATFLALLEELGAEPLNALPIPADHVRFPEGARVDLFHDTTITSERARTIASHMARLWRYEVHIIATPLDISTLPSHDRLSRRTNGRELVKSMHPLIRDNDTLLQTVFLTNMPLANDQGAVFGLSYHNVLQLVSTYYTDYFHKPDAKPDHSVPLPDLDEKVALSTQGGVIFDVINRHHFYSTNPRERYRPLPPDPFSASGVLAMNDRLFGVSPTTARLLGEIEPASFLERSHELHARFRDQVAEDDSPDTDAIRNIASQIADSEPVIVKP